MLKMFNFEREHLGQEKWIGGKEVRGDETDGQLRLLKSCSARVSARRSKSRRPIKQWQMCFVV